jgi:membrane-associated phospholipid phosphatase
MALKNNHNEEIEQLDSILDYTNNEEGLSTILFSKINKLKLAILSIATIIIIITEIFYRDPLFNASVKLEEKIHKSYDKDAFIFTIARLLSDLPALSIVIGVLVVYNFCNILKSFVFFLCLYSTFLVVGILKMIYQNPRPIWKSDKLHNLTTEGGFGNPSGHSFTSMLMFLSLYEILVNHNCYFKPQGYIDNLFSNKSNNENQIQNYNENDDENTHKNNISKNKNLAKYILLGLTISLILLVGLSRIILAVHSINQVLYGFSLALVSYYLIFKIIFPDLNDYKMFLKMIENVSFAFSSIIYSVIIMVTTLLVYGILSNEEQVHDYLTKIFQLAPKIPDYKVLYNESLMGVFVSVSFVGVILGISLEYTISLSSSSALWVAYNFGVVIDKTSLLGVSGNSNKSSSSNNATPNNNNNDRLNRQIDPENQNNIGGGIGEFSKVGGREGRVDENHNQATSELTLSGNCYDLLIWNNTSLWNTFKRVLVLVIGCAVLCIPTILIPGSADLLIIFLFKFSVPLTLVQLYLFYFYKRLVKVLGISNELIHERKNN